MTRYEETPSQTVGPFFAVGLPWDDGPYVVPPGTPGAFWLRGQVLDGAGEPVPDALVETWQADPDGGFDQPASFRAFARVPTDEEGRYALHTLKPGALPDAAPHIDVSVFARGLLDRVVTRVYFADEPDANALDKVLAGIDPARRGTLFAALGEDGYVFDIRLQGDRETVFFAV